MEHLKELISIVNKRKLSQIEVFDKSLISRKGTLFSKLYDGIANGNINSDVDAIHFLYDSNDDVVNYRKLKSRFKTRLLNTLHFIDINNSFDTDTIKKDYFDCLNKLYLSNILVRYVENRSASIHLILENYNTAKKNNFYDILKEYSYRLLVHYGINGEEKKYQQEYKAYQHYSREYELEQKTQVIYTKVLMFINNPKRSRLDNINELENCIAEIKSLTEVSNSLIIYFLYIRTQLFYFELYGNNNKIVELCDTYLNTYKNYLVSIFVQNYINTIQIYKLKSLIDMRKDIESLQLINSILPNSKGVSFLSVQEFKIKILLNKKETKPAKEILKSIYSNPIYKNASAAQRERWYIYNAYVEFMDNFLTDGNYKFSLSKLINDIPQTAQDKSRFNLAARIVTILFYIGRNDLDNAMQQIEALKIYQNRHLKDESNIRSNLFIRLLLIMEKKSFNYKALNHLNEYEALKSKYNDQIMHESEIIYYDLVWEMLLEILKFNDKKLLGLIK